MWKGWSPSRKLATLALALALVIGVAVAIAGSGNSGSPSSASATKDGGTSRSTGGTKGSSGGASAAGSDSSVTAVTTISQELPLTASVSGTKGLHSGDKVTVKVEANAGSSIYGIEMRLCKAGAVIRNDGDLAPTVKGQCATHALADGTDGYTVVAGQPPYREVTGTFTVGFGTQSFEMNDGSAGSVTCDPSHPCELAVKYQVPNGFGFRTYPLTFAS